MSNEGIKCSGEYPLTPLTVYYTKKVNKITMHAMILRTNIPALYTRNKNLYTCSSARASL